MLYTASLSCFIEIREHLPDFLQFVSSLFINRNNLVHNSTNYSKDDDIMAEFYIPS